MRISSRILTIFMLVGALAACAGMPRDFEQPTLSVSSVQFRNSNSIAPQFDVILHITNPNRFALNLQGMSYSIALAGNKVVTGVANNLPVVEAYGEADFQVSGAVSLLGGIRLLNELMSRNPDRIEYVFDARLDIGGTRPRININKIGEISLRGSR